MKQRFALSTLIAFFVFTLLAPAPVKVSFAEEPAVEFLNALRDRGYFDVAIDYLTEMENSPLATEEFKRILPFEKAQTLISSTGSVRDLDILEQRLDEAEQLLTRYASQVTTLPDRARTQRIRGNLLVARARVYRTRSNSDRLTAGERDALILRSRENLEGATTAFAEARQSQREAITSFVIDAADPSTIEERKKLQGIYTQIRLRQPIVIEQLADTYEDGNPRRRELLEEAIAEYLDLVGDYRGYMAALDGGYYAARCQYKLGLYDDALLNLKPLIELSDSSNVRPIKKRAVVLATDCWKAKDPYPFEVVVDMAQPVVATLSRAEQRDPDWLKVQLELAKASRMLADKIRSEGGSTSSTQIGALNRQSVRLIRNVARSSKELRDEANQLIAAWNLNAEEAEAEAEGPPASFADALEAGTDEINAIETLMADVTQARRTFESSTDSNRATAEEEYVALQDELITTAATALSKMDYALSLIDDKTGREDINKVRYYQCFCHYAAKNYLESALIGEYLVERFPQINYTRQAASLAVRSYNARIGAKQKEAEQQEAEQQESEQEEYDPQPDLDSLQAVCDLVLERWPGSNEAGTAASAMCNQAVNAGDLDLASEYFEKIPATYSSRGALAMQLGQRQWYAYSRGKNTLPADELRPLLQQARSYLIEGVQAANPAKLTYSSAITAQFLVNAHLAAGEVDEAIKQLEEAPIAPLRIVGSQNPVIMNHPRKDLYFRETFKAAVNCYLAKLRDGDDPEKWIEKASGVIAAMREMAADSPEAAEQVTAIYYLIAKQLKDDFDALPTPQEKVEFSSVLTSFLGAIEADSDDSKTVLWAGSTLLDVAASLNRTGMEDAARPLFNRAIEALNHAEELGLGNDPQLKWQRARAQRGSGQYEQAIEQFVEVIQEKNSLRVQFDAAETLHEWARSTGRSRGYGEAMSGTRPVRDPDTRRESNLIWGWRKLVMATKDNPDYIEYHINSMYYLIESRLEYGLLEDSDRAITAAANDMEKFRARTDELSQEPYKARYDDLERRIREAQN
ncbi:MAG: hypothetical protein AAF456_22225 [Planctomycetota bacterium]